MVVISQHGIQIYQHNLTESIQYESAEQLIESTEEEFFVALSTDGSSIAVGTDGNVTIYNSMALGHWSELVGIQVAGTISSIVLSGSGDRIVVATDERVVSYEIGESGTVQPLYLASGDSLPHAETRVLFSSNGNVLAIGGRQGGVIHIFDLVSDTWDERPLTDSLQGGVPLSLSVDGNTLAILCDDNMGGEYIHVYVYADGLWSLRGAPIMVVDRDVSATLSGDGRILAIGNRYISVLRYEHGQKKDWVTTATIAHPGYDLSMSEDARTLAIGIVGEPNYVRIYHINSGFMLDVDGTLRHCGDPIDNELIYMAKDQHMRIFMYKPEKVKTIVGDIIRTIQQEMQQVNAKHLRSYFVTGTNILKSFSVQFNGQSYEIPEIFMHNPTFLNLEALEVTTQETGPQFKFQFKHSNLVLNRLVGVSSLRKV